MRRALPVGLVSLAGLILFCWPFIGTGLPANTPAWALSIGCVAALLLVEAGPLELDSPAVALLAPVPPLRTAPRPAVIQGIGRLNPPHLPLPSPPLPFPPSFSFPS